MQVLGIEFAPLNIPLQRRLQTLAAAAWFVTLALGGPIFLALAIYLLFTRIWWLIILYFIWIYIDKDICEKGGRRIEWVRNWAWWFYFRDYFPLRLTKIPESKLDPKRNYLFCCFPHGMLSTGAFNAFATNASEFNNLFPHHKTNVVTLHQHYTIPFYRELGLSVGGISSTAKSLSYVLNWPEGGRIVALMPGGAAEAYFCQPGRYKILLKKRRGFIKLALRAGSPLVPVVSFGETDLFQQLEGPTLRRVQEFIRKFIGMAPVIPLGRGFFQYTFGIIPQRRLVTTVVGEPIDVEKIEDPNWEQINELHDRFSEALVKLFEQEKHKYLKHYENVHLEM